MPCGWLRKRALIYWINTFCSWALSSSVESKVGEGSCFKIVLPAGNEEKHLTTKPLSSTIPPQQKKLSEKVYKILYIEDNLYNLNLVQETLEKTPQIELLSARNGEDGIKLAQTFRPNLILMDILLPGMNGISAFKILQQIQETRNIPVVALSAQVMDSDVETALKMGFKDYICKPINIPEFLNRINNYLAE